MKKLASIVCLLSVSTGLYAQSPIDAYDISRQDLKGTARFMSMAGAFGALGGDLSALSQNPGGIGVYRSNEFGITFNLDCQHNTSDYKGYKVTDSPTKFNVTMVGAVGTLKLKSTSVPNINIGFTYNRAVSYNRTFKGNINDLKISLSNYIAGIANNYGLTESDVRGTDNYNPYNPPYGSPTIPYSTIIGYDSYLIDPDIINGGDTQWYGQYGNGTTGSASYLVSESGYRDEYNIALGGNIANKVFWGMNFGIVDMSYNLSSQWQENLQNAYVYDPNMGRVSQMNSQWAMNNWYNVNGTGFNYQLGLIVKPIQSLRIGFAFHTPTWYHLTENFYPQTVTFNYPFQQVPGQHNDPGYGSLETNNGEGGYNTINFRSPWKIIASIAGVFGSKCIVSADYEWNGYKNMEYNHPSWALSDYYWDAQTPADQTNDMIKTLYRNTSTIRLGMEYRVLNNLSLRLGYSYISAPVDVEKVQSGDYANLIANLPTAGTLGNYRFDNTTNYITAGLGYRYKGFYADAAYVWKHQNSKYIAFSPDEYNYAGSAMIPDISFSSSQIVLSLGYKF